MKSSTGKYYQALDHIRAVAVFVVFVWHFNHFDNGQLASPLVFPLSLFTEGHTGVAIFMVLSGYLFAKLLGNKKVNYPVFLYNRGLRLLPLLVCVLLIIAAQAYVDDKLNAAFFIHLLKGFVLPTLPNGGWSITVEFHFYIILPVLLITAIKFPNLLMFSLIVFVGARVGFYILVGEVQSVSYWTIIGRIDQFLLGTIGFKLKDHIASKKHLALPIAFFFLIFWFYFDTLGGFYNHSENPNIIRLGTDTFPDYEFGKTLDLNFFLSINKKNEKNLKYLFLVSLSDIDPGQELVAQYTFYQF